MEYYYKGLCEEAVPDFAALAVLEGQHCPNPISEKNYEEQICTSRYRIIQVLDSVSDTLKKEYLEAKEKPVLPSYRHRPMLIFGKYKNGTLQIEGAEETREYFVPFNSERYLNERPFDFLHLTGFSKDIYALHSIGSPYYDVKNLDSFDIKYYYEYLEPYIKYYMEAAGRNFNELQQRLTQNRKIIKAAKIKNDFAAIGKILDIYYPINDSKQTKYELQLMVETIFKNDAKINSDVTILIDRDNLPLGLGCMPLTSLNETPFYFFGDLKDGSLVIESLASTQDAFVFGDKVYDISMGLPFEELIAYFLPPDISLEEFKFNIKWDRFLYDLKEKKIIPKGLVYMPECLINAIVRTTVKVENFLENRSQTYKKLRAYSRHDRNFELLFSVYFLNKFRCREPEFLQMVCFSYEECFLSEEGICTHCKPFDSKGEGIWGK